MLGTGGQLEDEAAAGGLLSVDGNAGLLGIIKDEDSCQDSDFSGDENVGGAGNDDEIIPKNIAGAAAVSGNGANTAQ